MDNGSAAGVLGGFGSAIPSSPAALLQLLQSDRYQQQQQERARLISGSWRILTGCPWVASRSLHVIAVVKPGSELVVAYTLPTCTQKVCP